MKNMMMCLLVAMLSAQSIWAEIDDSNIVWTDLEGASKTGRWYTILPGQEGAPLVGAFTNGTIICNDTLWGSEGNMTRTLHVGEGGTHILNALWSGSGGTPAEVCIHDGGRFELAGANAYFGIKGYLRVKVHEGGTLVYGTTKIPNLAELKQEGNWFDISGCAEFPFGIRMGTDVSKPFVFYQRAGSSVSFGGDVDCNGAQANMFSYVIEGGSLAITGQCEFKIPDGKGEIAEGVEATIDIADGVVFDFSPFTIWGEGARLVKTGSGALGIGGGCVPSIYCKEGALVLCRADRVYDFSKVDFEKGCRVVFAAENCSIDKLDADSIADLEFSLELDATKIGKKILLSNDDELINAIKEKIEKNLGQGYRVEKEDGALVLKSNYVFNGSNGANTWNDANGWAGGSVPEGVPVLIKGEGVVCEISGEVSAESITVSGGATLKVSTAVELPLVNVESNSRILFAAGSDAVFDEYSFSGGKTELPVFEVEKGGKVSVPGGTVFHDVKVHLYGMLSTYGDGDLVIGGSSPTDDTNAWYDFICDGATINVQNGAFRLHWRTNTNSSWKDPWIYDNKTASDGNANKHKYVIKNTLFILKDGCEMSFGMNTGSWNPNYGETFDGTILPSSGRIYFGNANPDTSDYHTFINGGGIGLQDGVPGAASSVVLGFRKPELRLEGPNSFVNVDTIKFDNTIRENSGNRIYVRNSSRIRVRAFEGKLDNNKKGYGAFVFGDGIYEVGAAKEGETAPFAFCEEHGVKIEKDGVCRIRAIDDVGTPADRAVTLAAAPMSGEGALAIENQMGGDFGFSVTVTSSANTATGSASADEASRLLFANGANWAGEVVSKGNVGFGGDVPARVSMKALRVEAGALPVRVFVAEDGAVACDRVDVQDGGLEFAEGTGFSFEIPGGLKSVPVGSLLVVASAPAGTAVPSLRIDGFGRIRTVSDPEDAQRVLFVAERLPPGFKVTVR